jgi:hypothetical protein
MQGLVSSRKTGMLAVTNPFGLKADLFLAAGMLMQIKYETLDAVAAANRLAKRLYLTTSFTADQHPFQTSVMPFSTNAFLELLEKADKAFRTFSRTVPHLNVVFKLDTNAWGQEKKVSAQDWKVLTALDGRNTVHQVMAQSGLMELEVLFALHRFHTEGLIARLADAQPMSPAAFKLFINHLQEKLADIVGPAAGTLIDEAMTVIGSRRELLAEQHVPVLIEALGRNLDEAERRRFNASLKES